MSVSGLGSSYSHLGPQDVLVGTGFSAYRAEIFVAHLPSLRFYFLSKSKKILTLRVCSKRLPVRPVRISFCSLIHALVQTPAPRRMHVTAIVNTIVVSGNQPPHPAF